MTTNKTTRKHRDHTGVGWFVLGLVIAVVYGLFAVIGHHPTPDGTLSALWLGVIVGGVMVIFGLIGMTKRRHPGHY